MQSSVSVESVSSSSEICQLSEAPQQLCLILCVLFLWITVFCSVLNMPCVLGNAVDLAWCLKGFAYGQECFVLIKKGLQMQECQFSSKREESI